MKRGSRVAVAVCGLWLLQSEAGCGARSALLSDFSGKGGAQSSHAGTSGKVGAAGSSMGGRPSGGSGRGGSSTSGGAQPTSGGAAVMGGAPPVSGGFGGELSGGSGANAGNGGNAGQAGQAGQAGAASLCDQEQRYSEDLAKCARGFVHRERALACPLPARDEGGAAGAVGIPCPSPVLHCGTNEECQSDHDCPSGAYCIEQHLFASNALMLTTACFFSCRDDTDCYSTELCACSPFARPGSGELIELGTCRSARSCRVDADCGPGSLCSAPLQPAPFAPDLPSLLGYFACTNPRDECLGSEDCPPPSDKSCCADNLCSYDGLDHLSCVRREHCEPCPRN
jgi:hypothetical protein